MLFVIGVIIQSVCFSMSEKQRSSMKYAVFASFHSLIVVELTQLKTLVFMFF